ncbi:putative helitron helicase-like domain-containing protein [Helianthus debilis subsp. tardiflorus]
MCQSDDRSLDYDIVIRMKDGIPQRVNKLHSQYMSLQYPLLFLFGEHGWSPSLPLAGDESRSDRRLTTGMFYSYHLHDRFNTHTHLLRGGRLFQQFLVNAYVCIKQNRLEYIQSHQDLFRGEYLQGIHDAITRGDMIGHDICKHTILPSSFTGGPRYMYKH